MDSILNFSRPTLCRVRNLMACYVALLFLAITGLAQTTDPKKEFTGVFKFKNDGLSQRLLEAKTKEELQKLLDTESRNLSVQLRRSLVAQGNTPLAEGNYARAFDVYTIAQRVAEIINDREGIAATSLNIGTVYFLQGDYDNALNNYQKAYPIFERLGDQAEAARALVGIGSTLKEQGKGNAAVAPLQQAFTKFSSLKVPGSQEESSNILNLLGSIYYEEGKYELAKTTFAQSLLLVGSPSNILDVGNAYYSAGAYSQALELFLKALAQFESQRNTASISSALGSLANTYFALGDTEKALTYYQQNLRIIESLGDKNGAVSILQNMGDVYRLSGDFANALFSYTQSIKYADELAVGSASVSGSKLNTAVAAGGIGLVRAGQGDTVQALNYFHQSLSQFEKMGDKIGISRMLVNIGNSFGVQENYTEALDSYRKALALREEMGDTVNVAKILQNIGSVQISQDRLLEALESYQKSLALIKGVGNRMGEADVLVNIARTYRLIGQYSQAIDSAKSASTLVEGKDLSDTLWRAYLESGKSHLALKQIPEARVDLDRAVKTIESIRTAPFSIERERSSARSAVTPYYTMMEMLIGENKVDEAFEFAERGKTELLWSILQSGGTASSKSLSPQERQQESKMLDEIASLATQVKRAEARGRQEIVELQKRLRAARERFVVFRRTTAT
ncbi:MAG: tetratricopeptide repeat protein, partial [Pyrinomonadaceae bacterium]